MKSRLMRSIPSMRSILIRLMALLVVVFVSFASFTWSIKPAAATGTYSYNFEQSLSPWVPRADCTVIGFGLERLSGASACPLGGNWYARLLSQTNFGQIDGVWMITSYEESGLVQVVIDF